MFPALTPTFAEAVQQFARGRPIPRRVCVIKPSALGDVVQALPLLPVLRTTWPAAELTWVIQRDLADLVRGHPQLDRWLPFDRRGGLSATWNLFRDLCQAEFDVVFDLQGLLRTGLMMAATRAPVRIGLQTAREGAAWACHTLIPGTGREVPAHARYWQVAAWLGRGDLPRTTRIPVAPSDEAWARQRLAPGVRPWLGLQPGARWETKRWPAPRFAAVAVRAIREFGVRVCVLGSPAERQLAESVVQRIVAECPAADIVNLAGETSLKQLAACLPRISLVVTNDSGPMHLAAGLGVPVVGIFMCTSPYLSGPPGAEHRLVATHVPCAASYRKCCPQRGAAHWACWDELAVERVWQAVAAQLVSSSCGWRAAG